MFNLNAIFENKGFRLNENPKDNNRTWAQRHPALRKYSLTWGIISTPVMVRGGKKRYQRIPSGFVFTRTSGLLFSTARGIRSLFGNPVH